MIIIITELITHRQKQLHTVTTYKNHHECLKLTETIIKNIQSTIGIIGDYNLQTQYQWLKTYKKNYQGQHLTMGIISDYGLQTNIVNDYNLHEA